MALNHMKSPISLEKMKQKIVKGEIFLDRHLIKFCA